MSYAFLPAAIDARVRLVGFLIVTVCGSPMPCPVNNPPPINAEATKMGKVAYLKRRRTVRSGRESRNLQRYIVGSRSPLLFFRLLRQTRNPVRANRGLRENHRVKRQCIVSDMGRAFCTGRGKRTTTRCAGVA